MLLSPLRPILFFLPSTPPLSISLFSMSYANTFDIRKHCSLTLNLTRPFPKALGKESTKRKGCQWYQEPQRIQGKRYDFIIKKCWEIALLFLWKMGGYFLKRIERLYSWRFANKNPYVGMFFFLVSQHSLPAQSEYCFRIFLRNNAPERLTGWN